MTPKTEELVATAEKSLTMWSGGQARQGLASLSQLAERVKALREAGQKIFDYIEDGTLVRDISRDHEHSWVLRAGMLVKALKELQDALDKQGGADDG